MDVQSEGETPGGVSDALPAAPSEGTVKPLERRAPERSLTPEQLGIGGDLANIGSVPRQVVHVRVVEEKPL